MPISAQHRGLKEPFCTHSKFAIAIICTDEANNGQWQMQDVLKVVLMQHSIWSTRKKIEATPTFDDNYAPFRASWRVLYLSIHPFSIRTFAKVC